MIYALDTLRKTTLTNIILSSLQSDTTKLDVQFSCVALYRA